MLGLLNLHQNSMMICIGDQMEIQTEINHKDNFRLHHGSGDFVFEELMEALHRVYEDPQFDANLNSVWDLSGVKGIQLVQPKQLQKLVAYVSQQRSVHGQMRTAIVVSKKIDFGIARVYELSLEAETNNEVMVFRSLDKAMDWIKQSGEE